MAFKDTRPDEVDLLLHDDTVPTKESSSKISEEVHETNDDSMKIAHYGARKHKKVDIHLKCVAPDCSEVFIFVKNLNHHLRTEHPDSNANYSGKNMNANILARICSLAHGQDVELNCHLKMHLTNI